MADADLLVFHQEFDHLISCAKMDNLHSTLDWYHLCMPKELNKYIFCRDIDSLVAAKATVQWTWSISKKLGEEG
ncbi:hypothetical protein GGF37_002685, partial [Kickxella alabastrina]